MAFMRPEVYETDYLEIDGPMGGEIIPCDVADYQPTSDETRDAEVTTSDPPGSWVRIDYPKGAFPTPDAIRDYCENREIWSIERKHGWVGRMSASGYLDCTPWDAAETEEQIRAELKEHFGDDSDDE